MTTSYLELLELSKCLKKEKLFVESEKAQIQDLNKKVMKAVEELHHLSWTTRQQQLNLEGLILSRAGATPAACCRRDSMLHTASFVDSYKLLGPTDPFYSELLGQLRGQPALVARVLLLGERTAAGDRLTSLVDVVYSGIYGNGILKEDELSLLQVLRQLMVRQVVPAEQPQRLLRRGSCVFSRVYKAFSEGLFAAKLFLTSALHQPVMKLLMADEWYLDIDPSKVDEGLSDGEGRPGQTNAVAAADVSAEDGEAERERRRAAVADRLAALTNNFISHISAAAACFPPSLGWVVRSLHDLLRKGSSCTADQVNAMCVDLLFAFFICPAVVDPVQYGILEAPVGPAARHNLIQVGQILQTLAMNQCDEVEPRLRPFYHRFDKAAVGSLLGHILESGGPEPGAEPVLEPPSQLVGLARSAVLVTRPPLDHLVSLMRQLAAETTDAAEKKLLDSLTAHLPSAEQPPPPPPPPAAAPAPAHGTPPHQSHGGSRRSRILDKVQTSVQRRSSVRSSAASAGAAAAAEPAQQPEEPPLQVLVVALNTPGTCPGMISEQKVLCADSPAKPCRVRLSVGAEGDETGSVVSGSCGGDAGESETSAGEKRTRFRTGHDDGSIGNTSDILEVISEATSDGSDGSSLEDADQYKDDNLSDMISANVSGRETPNVSGRNTPSSQVTDEPDTAAAPGGGGREPPARDGPQRSPAHGAATGSKPPATVIEDKFGKFSIKPLNEDETVSMVSDTWSTDVLASDTETVEQVEAPLTSRQLLELCTGGVGVDVSETASEAWSTDVLGSDSERDRLAEVDAEDAASVTRSDDTARSEAAPAPAPTEPLKSSVSAPTFPAPTAPAPAATTARQERGRQMSGESVASDFSSASGLQRERGRTVAAAAGRSAAAAAAPASPQQQETPPRPARPATPPAQTPPGPESETKANGAGGEAGSSASSDSELPDPESNSVDQPPDSAGSESPLRPAASSSSAATGAIPKSISFDKSAERAGRRNADEQARRGFFKNLKLPFKTRRKGSRELVSERLERGSGDGRDVSDRKSGDLAESSDDILAKYRRKTPDVAAQARMGAPAPDAEEVSADLLRLTIDPENVQASYAFSDAKRKLRRVLAAANVQAFPWGRQIGGGDSPLLALLRLQLSEYISLHDHALMAQLHETIRCVSLFDAAGCQALLRSLREDYNSRSRYIAYLVRCRDGLLTTLSHVRLTVRHVRRDQTVCTRALVDKCVLLFLERHKRTLQRFQASFQQAAASDEKTDLVARFLAHLSDELLRDADWQAADDHQLHLAREAIEQMVMAQIYTMALYPNGEADVSRDQVLTGHMRRLALAVTPGHPDLKIPRIYHYEQPWPSAQAEITALNAYKTARDKVACVTRCCATIMNLLHIASERSVPAADDLIPVLVFVLIKASPASLLSTIQYVNSFYGERLEGEDLYWWTQFCSAAEFVKMMDY